MIQDCHEALSVLTLLLLLSTQEPKCEQIGSQALTILLAMSCAQQVGGDSFGSLMTEKQIFDVFQFAFIQSCKSSQSEVSDFIIILQKLSATDPQGIIANINQETLLLLDEIAAKQDLNTINSSSSA